MHLLFEFPRLLWHAVRNLELMQQATTSAHDYLIRGGKLRGINNPPLFFMEIFMIAA
jgi:hypothetical protein